LCGRGLERRQDPAHYSCHRRGQVVAGKSDQGYPNSRAGGVLRHLEAREGGIRDAPLLRLALSKTVSSL
jgi:hypothetical protein